MNKNQTHINGANLLQFDVPDNEINWRMNTPKTYVPGTRYPYIILLNFIYEIKPASCPTMH